MTAKNSCPGWRQLAESVRQFVHEIGEGHSEQLRGRFIVVQLGEAGAPWVRWPTVFTLAGLAHRRVCLWLSAVCPGLDRQRIETRLAVER